MNSKCKQRHSYRILIGWRRAQLLPLSLYPAQTMQLLRLDCQLAIRQSVPDTKVVIKRGRALLPKVKVAKNGERLLAQLADEMVKLGAVAVGVPANSKL